MTIVDLSHPIVTGMPVFPGDPEVTISKAATIASDGFNVLRVHMGSQSGTHIDAPSHFLDGHPTIDEVALDSLVAPGCVVDCRGIDPGGVIGPEQFEGVAVTGRIVLLHTGWDHHFGSDHYAHHPVLSEEAATVLRDAGVLAVGIDAFSVDPSDRSDHSFPAHMVLLGAGIPIAENLRGLEQVTFSPPIVSLLPLRLAGADGAPIRAVAWDGGGDHGATWPSQK